MSKAQTRLAVVLFVTLVLGGALYLAGLTPWIFFIGAVVAAYFACTTWLQSGLALAFVTLGNLALYAIFLQLYPLIPGALSSKNFVALAVEALASLVIIFMRPSNVGRLRIFANKPLAVSGVVLGFVFAIQSFWGGRNLSWAMNNDAVWNTIGARFLVSDAGLNASIHPNPSSLTAGIMAAAFSPGRELTASESLLIHDLGLESQMWTAVIVVSAFVAGMIVTNSLRSASTVLKWLGTFLAVGLPLTWYFSGYALNFGFYNASVAILILLLLWVTWQRARENPSVAILVISLGAIATLATWAPLVLVPMLFAIVVVVRSWSRLRARPSDILAPALGIVLVAGYAAAVTLRDLTHNSGALAVNGAIFDLQPIHFLLIAVVALVITFMARSRPEPGNEFLGLILVVIASIFGIAFLAFQRRDVESMWGYYPVKFAWLISCLLIVIIVAALLNWISDQPHTLIGQLFFVAASAVLALGLMAQAGLPSFKSFFTPVAVATETRNVGHENTLRVLSALAEPGQKNIVIQFGTDADEDLAFNNWLLQVNSDSSEDPIRWYSYFLNGTDLSMACEVVEKWGEGVVIHTRNPLLTSDFDAACPSVQVEVQVHD